MNQSRISQILMQSRSRHQPVKSPELNKITRQWQEQKKRSRESSDDVRKMLREMKYFQQLNVRLSKEVTRGREKVRQAERIRQRHQQDIKKKNYLEKLRLSNVLKNQEIANKIKQDRQKRLSAVQQSIYLKRTLGDSYRSESRQLKQKREQLSFEQYLKNRGKIESILENQANSREKTIRRKENSIMMHIRHHEQQIEREKKSMKIRQNQSMEIRNRLKTLTEASSRKLQVLDDIQQSINKYKVPRRNPYTPLNYKKNMINRSSRYHTEKVYMDKSEQESTIFVSQHYYDG